MSSPPPLRWRVRPNDGTTVAEVLARAGADGRAVDEGRVFIGRRRVRAGGEPVAVGDELLVSPPVAGGTPEVVILAEEGGLVAVEKPAGIPTIADHAGASHALREVVARQLGVPAARLHPTSRLDREVSGVVIFAATKDAADRLVRAREHGRYERRYVALASKPPAPPCGTWDTPIGRARDPRHRAPNGRDATPARTDYASVGHAGYVTLLALAPLTGRTHQLRVHASHAGAPLLGDRIYGGPVRLTRPNGSVLALSRIALHAARVVVPDARGEPLVVCAPIPPTLESWWLSLGGEASAWDTASSCPVGMVSSP